MTCLNYDRIYAQYRSKPKAVAWYQIIPTIGEQFCEVYNDIARSYDIDTNEGAQLDVIGRVIGINRDIIVDQPMTVCEFGADLSVAPGYTQYGNAQYGNAQYQQGVTLIPDCEFGDLDSNFSPLSTSGSDELNDEYYRKVLKSKVFKNTTTATIDEIIEAVYILAPNAENVRLLDPEDMSFSLEVFGNLSGIERNILLQEGIIPKPQGVMYNGFVEVIDLTEFGDSDLEFGDIDAEFAGYTGA